MMYVGIDENSELVYQGRNMFAACVVWPTPVVTPVTFVSADEREVRYSNSTSSYADLIFREDAFDPVSRIRRGRFYSIDSNGSIRDWGVIVMPPVHAFSGEIDSNRTDIAKKKSTYLLPISGFWETFPK